MRYPPALTFTPGSSGVHRLFASAFTIILIALCAYFITVNGLFNLKNSAFALLCLCLATWLLLDAWRKPRGQLQFSQGQWIWLHADQEIQGTLRLHLDLQTYMLVSFAPSALASQRRTGFFPIKTQWFHLEARHADPAARSQCWLALRRAVHAQVAHSHEEWAA
jgi:hypothetical protein